MKSQSKHNACSRPSLGRAAATALLAILLLAWAAPAFAVTVTATWDPHPAPNIAGYKLSYGTQSGVYTTTVDVGNVTAWPLSFDPGQYYFAVQAYDVFGQLSLYSTEVVISISSGGTTSSVTPSSGPVGASVEIVGSGFGPSQGTSTVLFNGVTASPTAWSDTSITVPVPSGATTGNVVVTVGGVPSTGPTFTVVPAAAIISLSPTTLAVGATVTITGTNFGPTQGTSTVTFNGVTAAPTAWSDTSITVPAPSGATTGNLTVTRGGVASNGVLYTVVPAASITSLSSSSGAAGATVVLSGANFGSPRGTSTISFNGVTAASTVWGSATIIVTVPSGATTGDVTVTRAGVASNGVPFTVLTASITSLSPTGGVVGAPVTITGTNFGSAQGPSTVKFNGVTASPTSWSATSITVPVPNGATTGDVTVTVGGVSSPGVLFTVAASGGSGGGGSPPPSPPSPTIISLSPTSGPVGASVTITGTNFGSSEGTSTVRFNGVTATPTSWSATSITVPVPSGARTGGVTVTVGTRSTAGVTFTVMPDAAITSLSPTSGAVGATVTITGTNFESTQGTSTLTFGGVTATPTSWSETSITVPVPSGATTGDVTVTVGGAASNGVTFTVTVPPTITSLSPASAAVGASVTIAGTNFGATQAASLVVFNGVAAAPTSWSAASITVPVPSGATTGNVTVTVGGVSSNGVTLTVVPEATGPPTMTVDQASLNFAAVRSGTSFLSQTPAQTVNIAQTGSQNGVSWTATSDSSWLTVSPASGTGPAALSIGVQYVSTLPPAGSASLTGAITVTYAGSATVTSTVIARLSLPAAPTAPTGVIDTPAAGATGLQGSIAVTGWAVDDVGVERVELWRDLQPEETTPPFASTPSDPRHGKVFIGNATLVKGARSDIEALNPTTPLNYRGGWGYLLLTWGLWNQGNGTYTLHAIAFDADGHAASLGQKTFGVANASANKPFGSIDTPAIGGTVSGLAVNFGWALTPKSGGTTCRVPATGVEVSIDSGPLQPVVFGDVRSDIAGAFAGFTNSAAAGGHFTFDTTGLTNGVHTIGWLITDDCNRADGVGSRFFTVQNSSGVAALAAAGAARAVAAPRASMVARVESTDPVVVARGFGELGVTVYPDSTGRRVVSLKEGERIELRLPIGYDQASQVALGLSRALPIGAHWDPASQTFAWQPAPGFLGDYEIVFVRGTETVRVRISVLK